MTAKQQMKALTEGYRRKRTNSIIIGGSMSAPILIAGLIWMPLLILLDIFILGMVSAYLADVRRLEDHDKMELLAEKIDEILEQ